MHKIDQLTAITPGAGVTKQYASLCGYKFGSATAVYRSCDMHLTFIGKKLYDSYSICGKL